MVIMAYSLVGILLFIALMHLYWMLGGKRGLKASIPTSETGEMLFEPTKFQMFIVVAGFLVFCVFILNKVIALPFDIPSVIERYALWFIGIIFLLRSVGDANYVGVIKKINDTEFGELDTKFYSPLCLLIGAGVIFLEWTL